MIGLRFHHEPAGEPGRVAIGIGPSRKDQGQVQTRRHLNRFGLGPAEIPPAGQQFLRRLAARVKM
jgi:hypothetical protein